ncbi:MAG: DUF4917 family protein [Dehalococcoidia bacterium]|nr:DUF4917 family protein [Dehalococcoidia bacterium]
MPGSPATFRHDWQFLASPHGDLKGYTMAFYPHGNLMLTSTLKGYEWKEYREERSRLLDKIIERWESGEGIPLFVSEGDTRQKRSAILRSEYLSTVYDSVLPEAGPAIAIYGWSMGDNDSHILRQIGWKAERLAVSVHMGRAPHEIEADCARIQAKVSGLPQRPKLEFFRADSPGCWIYPEPTSGRTHPGAP